MSAREIRVELPEEPAPRSVVLMELVNHRVGDTVTPEYLALQRSDNPYRSEWYACGHDVARGPLSWAELIGMAGGRLLVLWEPPGKPAEVTT